MKTLFRIFAALLVLAAGLVHAQNTISFGAQTTTGDGSVVPILNWSTTPAASSCTASGATNWTGTKAASGTQTLPAITASATYNLTCTWGADTTATVSWTNPTTNTDGSNYTDPLSVRLKYTFAATLSAGPTCGTGETCINVSSPAASFVINNLTTVGTFRVVGYAQNQRMVFSSGSNVATKVFSGAPTDTKSVGITVNPVPNALTGLGVL